MPVSPSGNGSTASAGLEMTCGQAVLAVTAHTRCSSARIPQSNQFSTLTSLGGIGLDDVPSDRRSGRMRVCIARPTWLGPLVNHQFLTIGDARPAARRIVITNFGAHGPRISPNINGIANVRASVVSPARLHWSIRTAWGGVVANIKYPNITASVGLRVSRFGNVVTGNHDSPCPKPEIAAGHISGLHCRSERIVVYLDVTAAAVRARGESVRKKPRAIERRIPYHNTRSLVYVQ